MRCTEPPSQNVSGPSAVITGAGGAGNTVTVTGSLAVWHPDPSVTVTVYVPDCATVIQRVVAPVLHRYAAPALDSRVMLPPAQNVVDGRLGVITGFGGSRR